jgi:hypothetical protein
MIRMFTDNSAMGRYTVTAWTSKYANSPRGGRKRQSGK